MNDIFWHSDDNIVVVEDYILFDGNEPENIGIGGFNTNKDDGGEEHVYSFIKGNRVYIPSDYNHEDTGRTAVYLITEPRGEGTVTWIRGSVQVSNGDTYNMPIFYDTEGIESTEWGSTAYDVWDAVKLRIIACNIPIFPSIEGAIRWIEDGDNAEEAVNYKQSEHIKHYYIRNTYGSATAGFNEITYNDNVPTYRMLYFTVNGKAALVKGEDYQLTLQVKGDIISSGFASTDSINVPETTEGSISYYGPFYNRWDGATGENITVSYNPFTASAYRNVPILSEEDVEKYFDGDNSVLNTPENEGLNEGINSTTGDPEITTTFGNPTHTTIFNRKYVLGPAALREVAGNMYDTDGFWEDLEKGLKMYGSNPIDAVVGLQYWPININEVLNTAQRQSVVFGSYVMNTENVLNWIISESGYIDMGEFQIDTGYSLDNIYGYEPYTKLYFYGPYVGTHQLDLKKYAGKTVTIRYFIDTNTGGCMCSLIVDNKMMDYYNGQMAVNQPLIGRDFASFANAQINTLLGAGNSAMSNASGAMGAGSAAISGATGAGSLINNLGGIGAQAVVGAAGSAAMTTYNLSQNSIQNFTKTVGASSSMLNEFLPQYPYFIFERVEIEETSNLGILKGKPSNASGTVGSFSGYLEVDDVELICSKATEAEKNEIIQLLHSGIRI